MVSKLEQMLAIVIKKLNTKTWIINLERNFMESW